MDSSSSRRGLSLANVDSGSIVTGPSGDDDDDAAAANPQGLLTVISSPHALSVLGLNERTGDFSIADGRGKLFSFSPSTNSFELAKKATTAGPLSAVAYLLSKPSMLLLGYASGQVVCYDTNGKRPIASVQTPSGAPARIMRAHPSKLMAVIADASDTLSVWDFRRFKSTLQLKCQEEVVDIQFFQDGALLALLLKGSGLHIYRSSDMSVALRCPFPDSERKPAWTSMCHAPSTTPGSLRFVLGGENGTLYLWETETPYDYVNDAGLSADQAPLCALVGLVDLPGSASAPLSMRALGPPALQPQILILCNDGGVLVLDAQGFGAGSIGIWTVMADLPPFIAAGASESDENDDGASAALGLDLAAKDTLFLVLARGSARLFEVAASLGTGLNVATMLRTRIPHPSIARVPVFRVIEGQKVATKPSIKVRERVGISATEKAAEKAAAKKAKQDSEGRKQKQDAAVREKAEAKKLAEEARMSKYNQLDEYKEPEALQPEKANAAGRKATTAVNANSFPASFSLYDMASHAPADKQLNEHKLRSMLASQHEFPVRYRQVIWRYLLRLPENAPAFAELAKRGEHKAYHTLHERYPVRSRRLFHRLSSLCSQLAHWSPIFGEIPYLPQFVFPFVVVYGVDELAALETVMSIFMWWGFSWHATYPQPPVHVMDAIDRLVKLQDSKLYHHMVKRGAPPGVLGWAILSTIFTEVLSRENWLRLMDQVLLDVARPQTLYLAVVAVLCAIRGAILHCDSSPEIIDACRRQHSVDFVVLSKTIAAMAAGSSTGDMLAGVVPMTRFEYEYGGAKGGRGEGSHSETDDVVQARECLALSHGHPIFPLPAGRYPAFEGYPKYVLDWQLRDRSAAMALGQAAEEDVLSTLQKRVERVSDNHREWAASQEAQARLEEQGRKAAHDKERAQLRELARIEEEINRQRSAALVRSEESAREHGQALEAARRETESAMRLAEEHMQERAALSLSLQQQREFAAEAEAQAQARLSSMHVRRSKEEWVKAVERGYEEKELELRARDELLKAQGRKQEEEHELRREQRRRRAEFDKEEEALVQVHDVATQRMNELLLKRESDAIDLQRQRALRLAREQADEAADAAIRAQVLLKKHEAAVLQSSEARVAAKGTTQANESYRDMLGIVRSEGERAAEEERKRIFTSRLQSARAAAELEHEALVVRSQQQAEERVGEAVELAGRVQERELEKLAAEQAQAQAQVQAQGQGKRGVRGAAAAAMPGARESDDSSIDLLLSGLGSQVKQQVKQGAARTQGPKEDETDVENEGEDLNDSALWAYDDPLEN